jgi:hypothetical protein
MNVMKKGKTLSFRGNLTTAEFFVEPINTTENFAQLDRSLGRLDANLILAILYTGNAMLVLKLQLLYV